MDSEGLLLMTNDGAWMQRLLHPSREVEKEYRVTVTGPVEGAAGRLTAIRDLEGERIRPARVRELWRDGNKAALSVTIHEGKNRQIRRMCRALDYHVMNLKRVRIMNLQLGTLKRGEYRELTEKELGDLMRMVEGSTNLPAREAAKLGKIVDPAKRERKPGSSGYQGKPGGRKPSDKNNERKPFEKKTGTGKVWKNVRQDGEIKPEKKAPASPESWKPGAPERKEHKIWTTRSRG